MHKRSLLLGGCDLVAKSPIADSAKAFQLHGVCLPLEDAAAVAESPVAGATYGCHACIRSPISAGKDLSQTEVIYREHAKVGHIRTKLPGIHRMNYHES